VHPITALQTEYSPWTRNPEIAVLDACRDLGVAFVAFSPVARGFLTGATPDPQKLDAKDIRRGMPRFGAEHWATNLRLLPAYTALAKEVGCTPAQLSLAWLLSRGEHVIPIPGTSNIDHLRENIAAAAVMLPPDVVERVDALIHRHSVSGPRYSAGNQGEVDTEEFA
jgi:aryl-alcohol dehydrogenase-like predicted oxidoreductase